MLLSTSSFAAGDDDSILYLNSQRTSSPKEQRVYRRPVLAGVRPRCGVDLQNAAAQTSRCRANTARSMYTSFVRDIHATPLFSTRPPLGPPVSRITNNLIITTRQLYVIEQPSISRAPYHIVFIPARGAPSTNNSLSRKFKRIALRLQTWLRRKRLFFTAPSTATRASRSPSLIPRLSQEQAGNLPSHERSPMDRLCLSTRILSKYYGVASAPDLNAN